MRGESRKNLTKGGNATGGKRQETTEREEKEKNKKRNRWLKKMGKEPIIAKNRRKGNAYKEGEIQTKTKKKNTRVKQRVKE